MTSAFSKALHAADAAFMDAVYEALSQRDAAIKVAATTNTDAHSADDYTADTIYKSRSEPEKIRRAILTMETQHKAEAEEERAA